MQALNITIFGIITVSLDVGIVNVFFIQFGCVCILISYYNALWHCVNFSGKRVTAHPEGDRMPILILCPLHCMSGCQSLQQHFTRSNIFYLKQTSLFV